MSYKQREYIQLVSPQLNRFIWKDKNRAQFRCPFCGDSQKNEFKARAWLIEKDDEFLFYCHNCFIGLNFTSFMKDFDPGLYNEYKLETFGNTSSRRNSEPAKFMPSAAVMKRHGFDETATILTVATRLDKLSKDHPAIKFVDGRRLPTSSKQMLYYIDDITKLAKKIDAYKDAKLANNECILIPFYSADKRLIYIQCRFMHDYGQRYMTLIVDELHPKVFGLDRLNKANPAYILEGPFDSLFINNGLAMGGADISADYIKSLGINPVFVYDNERRNPQIISKISKSIDAGFSVVIWDITIKQKDINDMHLAGMSIKFLNEYLKSHTFKGMAAKLHLNHFKR